MKYDLAYNEFHNLESIGIEGKDENSLRTLTRTATDVSSR